MSFTVEQNKSSSRPSPAKSRSSQEAFAGETDEGEVASSPSARRSPSPRRVGVDERGAAETVCRSPSRSKDHYKTKLCEFYPKCPDGRSCSFAHGAHELRKNVRPPPYAFPKGLRYKTEMCHRVPHCRSGDRCNFAHSRSELRRAPFEDGRRRQVLFLR